MSKLHVNKAGPSILNPANHPVHITAAVQGRDLPKGELQKWSGQRRQSYTPTAKFAAFETPWRKEVGQALGLMAQSAMRCCMPTCTAPLPALRLRNQRQGFRCQRPLLSRASISQALEQTGSDQSQKHIDASAPSAGYKGLLTSCAVALASALVAASPAAATLGPADVMQLQETLSEVWGEKDISFYSLVLQAHSPYLLGIPFKLTSSQTGGSNLGAMRQAEGLAVPASMFSVFALVFPLAVCAGSCQLCPDFKECKQLEQ